MEDAPRRKGCFLIEAIRALMVADFDWDAIAKAILAMGAMGVVLQAATLWAFRRLAT